jgi:cytosine/creatinine deaminase
VPHIVIGENQTFRGEEELLRSRGVHLDVRQDVDCLHMMKSFITNQPKLWNEDIGEED